VALGGLNGIVDGAVGKPIGGAIGVIVGGVNGLTLGAIIVARSAVTIGCFGSDIALGKAGAGTPVGIVGVGSGPELGAVGGKNIGGAEPGPLTGGSFGISGLPKSNSVAETGRTPSEPAMTGWVRRGLFFPVAAPGLVFTP
jgi:hypothetical protein